MVINNVLQHYYDERCSQESWSSLLMSPLAEHSEVMGHIERFDDPTNALFKR